MTEPKTNKIDKDAIFSKIQEVELIFRLLIDRLNVFISQNRPIADVLREMKADIRAIDNRTEKDFLKRRLDLLWKDNLRLKQECSRLRMKNKKKGKK